VYGLAEFVKENVVVVSWYRSDQEWGSLRDCVCVCVCGLYVCLQSWYSSDQEWGGLRFRV